MIIQLFGYAFLWIIGSWISGMGIMALLSFTMRKSDGMAAMAVTVWAICAWWIICGISGILAAGIFIGRIS